MQTKTESAIEVTLNIGTGFIISWILTLLVLPYFGFKQVTTSDGFWITLIFTVVSVCRSYIWRRLFNKRSVLKTTVEHTNMKLAESILYVGVALNEGISSHITGLVELSDEDCRLLSQTTMFSYHEIRSSFKKEG